MDINTRKADFQRSDPTTARPVRSITALATGTADAHVEHIYGSKKHPFWWIFFGRKRITLPISVFVIRHERGLVLFDTGVDQAVVSDPSYWPDRITRLFMENIFRFHLGPDDTLSHQLESVGVHAADIEKAVISHLHFDHAGGIARIPGAELLVSTEAWEHMLGAHPEREGVLRRDIDIPGARWNKIDPRPLDDELLRPFTHGHDVMGDGSLILVPTPGHLPGSLSLFVRTDPPVLFVGDVCYSLDLLMQRQLPGTGELDVLKDTWEKIAQLKDRLPELLVVPSHDPAAVAELQAHPFHAARLDAPGVAHA